jgi:hypothetical protein
MGLGSSAQPLELSATATVAKSQVSTPTALNPASRRRPGLGLEQEPVPGVVGHLEQPLNPEIGLVPSVSQSLLPPACRPRQARHDSLVDRPRTPSRFSRPIASPTRSRHATISSSLEHTPARAWWHHPDGMNPAQGAEHACPEPAALATTQRVAQDRPHPGRKPVTDALSWSHPPNSRGLLDYGGSADDRRSTRAGLPLPTIPADPPRRPRSRRRISAVATARFIPKG